MEGVLIMAFDITSYILGKKSGGGGSNPNTVQTVTGTMANPWGDVDFEAIRAALATGNASATMDIQSDVLNIHATLFLTADVNNITASCGYVDTTNYYAFTGIFPIGGTAPTLYLYSKNAGYVDGSAYASIINSTLTITWHPMP